MPYWFFYFWFVFHPMPMQPVKGYAPPPAVVQPAPAAQDFSCRIIKYPSKGDPTQISICP